jgi:hypothetical protein
MSSNLVRQEETFTRWIKLGIDSLIQNSDDADSWESTTIVENDEFSTHYIIENYMIIAPDGYDVSLDVKLLTSSRTKLKIYMNGPFVDFDYPYSIYDIENAEVTDGPGSIAALGDDWYRCTMSVTTEVYSPFNMLIMLVSDDGDDYLGDGVSGMTIKNPEITVS